MNNLFSKEDLGLSQDVEIHENTINMYDSPLEVLLECFPDESNPQERLHHIYINYAKTYLDKPEQLSIKQIIEKVSLKARKSTAEIELEIKWIIEDEFVCELEYKTTLSETIIHSIPKELWLNKDIMKSALAITEEEVKYVKKQANQLTDKQLYDNKLIRGTR